jgi:iron complex transport system substrate-binding protein
MFYPSFPTAYYDRLSRSDALSLSVDTDVVSLLRVQNGNAVVDKEFFYEADADVFLLDPNTLTRYSSSWSDDDTEEVAGEVGPFVGHHGYHDPGSMGYDHLPLYDYFRVVADVFRKRDRFEAFAALHDEVRSRIRGRIDGLDRPRVAVVASGSDPAKGTFWPVGIRTGAWGSKQFRDLDVRDAWDGVVPGDGSAGAVGYEALAEADPDVVVYQNHLASRAGFELRGSEEWRANYVEPLAGHGAGSAVTAVEEGNVYPTALHVQGPLLNLQAMEFTAKQLFPDEFDADEELFDRERLASVCDGDI